MGALSHARASLSLLNGGALVTTTSTSFYEVKCADGYHCVSSIAKFGMNHDGPYNSDTAENKPEVPPLFRDAFESNCPAKGVINEKFECTADAKSQGPGRREFCWSFKRFEAGPGAPCTPDTCMCVESGLKEGTSGKFEEIIPQKGKLMTGEVDTQRELKCEECRGLNCDMSACDRCETCEWKTVWKGSHAGLGCYPAPQGKKKTPPPQSEVGHRRLFDFGEDPVMRHLKIVPHYHLWEPGARPEPHGGNETEEEAGSRHHKPASADAVPKSPDKSLFPWDANPEWFSRAAWMARYPNTAGRIQLMMDDLAKGIKIKKKQSHKITCEDYGESVEMMSLAEAFNGARRICMRMQDQAGTLNAGKNIPFKRMIRSNRPGEEDKFLKLNCITAKDGKGKDDMCTKLNCYGQDEKVRKDFNEMYAKINELIICNTRKAQKRKVQEEMIAAGKKALLRAGKEGPEQAAAAEQQAQESGKADAGATVAKSMMAFAPSMLLFLDTMGLAREPVPLSLIATRMGLAVASAASARQALYRQYL